MFKIKHNERIDDDDVINAKLYPFITFQQRKKKIKTKTEFENIIYIIYIVERTIYCLHNRAHIGNSRHFCKMC